jgi:RHS repeat-associated protein
LTRGVDQPEVEGYQWDGWKLIMIAKLNSNGTFHSRKWSCVWRPDVGSSLYARSDWMRAGGVGGVAWLQTGAVQSYSYGTGGAEVHVPLADHMGNVRHYYQFRASGKSVTGQLVASYEYDAFGREVRAWGLNTPATNQPPGLPASRPWADLLPFHYSSKLRDVDSGFNYYGYRFYDPGAGRWLNRDPIGERGGLNLYGMVGNDAVGRVDVLGLKVGDCYQSENEALGAACAEIGPQSARSQKEWGGVIRKCKGPDGKDCYKYTAVEGKTSEVDGDQIKASESQCENCETTCTWHTHPREEYKDPQDQKTFGDPNNAHNSSFSLPDIRFNENRPAANPWNKPMCGGLCAPDGSVRKYDPAKHDPVKDKGSGLWHSPGDKVGDWFCPHCKPDMTPTPQPPAPAPAK